MIEPGTTENDERVTACGMAVSRQARSVADLDAAELRNRLISPAASLGVGLVLAVGLMLAPAGWSAAAKGRVADVLRPGQAGVFSLREHASRLVARARSHVNMAAKLAEAERERERLAEENRRLAAELAVVKRREARLAQDSDVDSLRRLLTARCVKARVLGEQARTFLGRQHLLDVGSDGGVQPDTLVVHAPPGLIDQGGDANLKAGQLVLSQGSVWGKVVEVGRLTSVVRVVTEPGYRDLVRLRDSGPEGILEGTGEPLARIRLVEVTEPVSVGDEVYSTAGKGFLPEPPLYGTIVRVERPVGAAHWEIWMQPAVDPHRTDEVAVLPVELNPLRVARGSGEWGVVSKE